MAGTAKALFDRLQLPSADRNAPRFQGVCSLFELAASAGEARNEAAFRLGDLVADGKVGPALLEVLSQAAVKNDRTLRAIAASKLAVALKYALDTNEEATIIMLGNNPDWLKQAGFFANLADEKIKVICFHTLPYASNERISHQATLLLLPASFAREFDRNANVTDMHLASFYLRVLEGLTPALDKSSLDARQVLESLFAALFEVSLGDELDKNP